MDSAKAAQSHQNASEKVARSPTEVARSQWPGVLRPGLEGGYLYRTSDHSPLWPGLEVSDRAKRAARRNRPPVASPQPEDQSPVAPPVTSHPSPVALPATRHRQSPVALPATRHRQPPAPTSFPATRPPAQHQPPATSGPTSRQPPAALPATSSQQPHQSPITRRRQPHQSPVAGGPAHRHHQPPAPHPTVPRGQGQGAYVTGCRRLTPRTLSLYE